MRILLAQLSAAVAKETRIIVRDLEALAILFVLPAVFVLVMSLAMQDAFSEKAGATFSMVIVDADGSDLSKGIIDAFDGNSSFRVETRGPAEDGQDAALREDITHGRYQFAILVPRGAAAAAERRARQQLGLAAAGGVQAPVDIRFLADPTLRRDHRETVVNALNLALQKAETGILLQAFNAFRRSVTGRAAGPSAVQLFSKVQDPYQNQDIQGPVPTSVQQNAPGWALLAMFFLVIPMSGTLVRERQEGGLLRLQTMAAPISLLLGGKMVPYFIINQIQIGLILLEGIYLLPLLGGERLDIGAAPAGIVLLTCCISLAAIGYGLMIAAFSRTTEQATIFGATSILILGALGGIMVPTIVMPPFMQEITRLSPMSWGLEGFMDIFVRGGKLSDVVEEALSMLAFGGVCLTAGVLRFGYKLRHN